MELIIKLDGHEAFEFMVDIDGTSDADDIMQDLARDFLPLQEDLEEWDSHVLLDDAFPDVQYHVELDGGQKATVDTAMELDGLINDLVDFFAYHEDEDLCADIIEAYGISDFSFTHVRDVSWYSGMTLEDVAREFVDEGLFGDVSDTLKKYIDYEQLGNDLSYDGYTECLNGTVCLH